VTALPIKRVVVRATGHVCHINASDFNPDLHQAIDDPMSAEPASAETVEVAHEVRVVEPTKPAKSPKGKAK
jgi:hypothetical protein